MVWNLLTEVTRLNVTAVAFASADGFGRVGPLDLDASALGHRLTESAREALVLFYGVVRVDIVDEHELHALLAEEDVHCLKGIANFRSEA
jgi:hypothetical protein